MSKLNFFIFILFFFLLNIKIYSDDNIHQSITNQMEWLTNSIWYEEYKDDQFHAFMILQFRSDGKCDVVRISLDNNGNFLSRRDSLDDWYIRQINRVVVIDYWNEFTVIKIDYDSNSLYIDNMNLPDIFFSSTTLVYLQSRLDNIEVFVNEGM